jgi:hypothetical protein
MGSSLRRRKFRLQTGVTKMVCHLVDWPLYRGGRGVIRAARKQMKGLKSPSERKRDGDQWRGISNRAAKILSCSKALLEGRRLSTPSQPPALPPRKPNLPPRPLAGNTVTTLLLQHSTPDFREVRKARHVARKLTWCTERANWLFGKCQWLAIRLAEEGSGVWKDGWGPVQGTAFSKAYVTMNPVFHTMRRALPEYYCRDYVVSLPFYTIGMLALCEKSLKGFIEVFSPFYADWDDPSDVRSTRPVCICEGDRNKYSCRIHGKENRRRRAGHRGKRPSMRGQR